MTKETSIDGHVDLKAGVSLYPDYDDTDDALPLCAFTAYHQPMSIGRKPISTLPADSYCAGNAALC